MMKKIIILALALSLISMPSFAEVRSFSYPPMISDLPADHTTEDELNVHLDKLFTLNQEIKSAYRKNVHNRIMNMTSEADELKAMMLSGDDEQKQDALVQVFPLLVATGISCGLSTVAVYQMALASLFPKTSGTQAIILNYLGGETIPTDVDFSENKKASYAVASGVLLSLLYDGVQETVSIADEHYGFLSEEGSRDFRADGVPFRTYAAKTYTHAFYKKFAEGDSLCSVNADRINGLFQGIKGAWFK